MKSQRNEELTQEECAHMAERFLSIMRAFERIWHEHKLGTLSEDQFKQHLDLLRWAISVPEPRRMWVQLAQTFDTEFRAIVDTEVLADHAPTSSLVKAIGALGARPTTNLS